MNSETTAPGEFPPMPASKDDFGRWTRQQALNPTTAMPTGRETMSGTAKETDKEVLRRVMSEPTFKAAREAAIRENEKRKKSIVDMLREAAALAEGEQP